MVSISLLSVYWSGRVVEPRSSRNINVMAVEIAGSEVRELTMDLTVLEAANTGMLGTHALTTAGFPTAVQSYRHPHPRKIG